MPASRSSTAALSRVSRATADGPATTGGGLVLAAGAGGGQGEDGRPAGSGDGVVAGGVAGQRGGDAGREGGGGAAAAAGQVGDGVQVGQVADAAGVPACCRGRRPGRRRVCRGRRSACRASRRVPSPGRMLFISAARLTRSTILLPELACTSLVPVYCMTPRWPAKASPTPADRPPRQMSATCSRALCATGEPAPSRVSPSSSRIRMAGSPGVGRWFVPPLVAERSRMICAPHSTMASALPYSGRPSGPRPGAGVQGVAPVERDGAFAQVDAPHEHVGAAGAVFGHVGVQGGLAAVGGGDDEGVPGAVFVVDGQVQAVAGVGVGPEHHRAGHDRPAGRERARGRGRGG